MKHDKNEGMRKLILNVQFPQFIDPFIHTHLHPYFPDETANKELKITPQESQFIASSKFTFAMFSISPNAG